MTKKTAKKSSTPSTSSSRSAEDAAFLEEFSKKRNQSCPPVKVTSVNGANVSIVPDHPDLELGICKMLESLGVSERGFADHYLSQIATACSQPGQPNEPGINFALAV